MEVIERVATIKATDMDEQQMIEDAVDCSAQALEKFEEDKNTEIAGFIKKEFDRRYSPTWHCVVGKNFGGYVTHELTNYIYFYLDEICVKLWRSG